MVYYNYFSSSSMKVQGKDIDNDLVYLSPDLDHGFRKTDYGSFTHCPEKEQER